VGNFEAIITVKDRITLIKVLEMSLKLEKAENLQEISKRFFEMYLENAEISDKEKQKIKEKENKILESSIKKIKKNREKQESKYRMEKNGKKT
jgi:cob(I)alamin adenosyltransferase